MCMPVPPDGSVTSPVTPRYDAMARVDYGRCYSALYRAILGSVDLAASRGVTYDGSPAAGWR